MDNDLIRSDIRLVLIANDCETVLNEHLQACEAAGLQVASAAIGSEAFGIAAAASPSAIIISLATDAGLPLLQQLASDPRTARIPVVVAMCHSDHSRVRAEQVGSVALFIDQPSPRTLVSAVFAVIAGRDYESNIEFPARCPNCETRAGMPRSVSTASQSGTYVGLQCSTCGQGWRVLRPGATPAARTSS